MADTLKPKQLAGIFESIPKDKLDDAAAYLIYKLEKQCWQIGIFVEPA